MYIYIYIYVYIYIYIYIFYIFHCTIYRLFSYIEMILTIRDIILYHSFCIPVMYFVHS